MQIISYNVNGIRAAIKKGFWDWMKVGQYDIVCVQETKAQPEQVDITPLEDMGYHAFWHSAEKKGYSGVATFSKEKPLRITQGCGMAKYDAEGRILITEYPSFILLNCYFPSGTTGDVRQDFKMAFLADFQEWIKDWQQKGKGLIIVGDYNIAHQEIDIHNPKSNKNSSGFLPEERAWMTEWFKAGFTDAFRHVAPEKVEYSWWSFRANARANNKGWRIDYQSVSDHLAPAIQDVRHLGEAKHSDHCPVWMDIQL